jgi:hypothetical protein
MKKIKEKATLNMKLTIIILLALIGFIMQDSQVFTGYPVMHLKAEAAETTLKTYTVKATSNPYGNKYTTSSTYNSYTKQYYMLRSFLEQIEKNGGGNLVLTSGTYTITNTLYVPSNTTIVLNDGVKIVKGNKTGTTKLNPTKSLFQLVAPSKSGVANTSTGYNGASGISILGKGNAIIDLNYSSSTVGLVIGHNSKVTIEGITFQKMYGGSFIRLAASKNVTIRKNTFQYHKDSDNNSEEAISIDIPDALVNGFNYAWSKNDKTVNSNITIQYNSFLKLERAIGGTKYTQDKYHSNIKILDNTITETDSHAIRVLNWDKPVILNNTFSKVTNTAGSLKAILASGVKYPTITGNTIQNSDRPIQIMPWKNSENVNYGITYNVISDQNKTDMLKNTLLSMKEYYIRYNKTYNEFTKNTEKWSIIDTSIKTFTITPTSEPYQNNFINYSTYNTKTKQYYVFRSYLEQLEKLGGGTLTIRAGTYDITNTLYVPSHVTIVFEDGVIIRKSEDTGNADFKPARSIFQLVAPTKSSIDGVYGGYNGETDIHFVGSGSAIIDLNYVQDALGIIFGHNTNVSIKGINFQNMYSGHFIELDASSNRTIENNTFKNAKKSESGMKEAINLDTPDRNTGGFNSNWSNYDCTANKDVLIQNNTFQYLERAIGTHKYSVGKYHENVQILNNTITNTTSDAIRILNWTNPIIKYNVIKMVAGGNGTYRAVLASGVSNPTITGNTFSDVARPIQIMPWKNSDGGSEYAITYNTISSANITAMLKNDLIRVGERFIRINKVYNVFDSNTDKYYYQ